MTHTVLDATCGGRMIWHETMKNADGVVYSDCRTTAPGEINPNRENAVVAPDVLADARELPFPDATFDLICYDPPHRITEDGMQHLGGIIPRYYGALRAETWRSDLRQSMNELFRVLAPGGTLTLKWADETRPFDAVLDAIDQTPLYGTNTKKGDSPTYWWTFHKSR